MPFYSVPETDAQGNKITYEQAIELVRNNPDQYTYHESIEEAMQGSSPQDPLGGDTTAPPEEIPLEDPFGEGLGVTEGEQPPTESPAYLGIPGLENFNPQAPGLDPLGGDTTEGVMPLEEGTVPADEKGFLDKLMEFFSTQSSPESLSPPSSPSEPPASEVAPGEASVDTIEESPEVTPQEDADDDSVFRKRLKTFENTTGNLGVHEDSRGINTIGYGFNVEDSGAKQTFESALDEDFEDFRSGRKVLSEEQAEQLLDHSISRAEEDARKRINNFDKLPSPWQEVLLDMSYQLGSTKLGQFDKMISAIEGGSKAGFIKEFKNSDYFQKAKGGDIERTRNNLSLIESADISEEELLNNLAAQ